MSNVVSFNQLVEQIHTLHEGLAKQIGKAINIGLTLRNWLIGEYIAEYELQGTDRAEYGEHLFDELARALNGISNCNRRQLYRYVRFYRLYPEIMGTLSPQFPSLEPLLQKVGTESLTMPGFIAFNPAYDLRHTGRDCRYPGHTDARPGLYAIRGFWVPAIPAGTTARRGGGWL